MKNSLLISSAAVLLGIAVFKVASSGEGRGDSEVENDRATIQKSARKTSGEGRGSHSESKARSLDELREGWDAILPARGHSLFDEKEMLAFLKTLNLRETEMLVRDLLAQDANKDATSRVIGRWGELDPGEAIEFLAKTKIKSDLFAHHLYVGWVKHDRETAFAHYLKNQSKYGLDYSDDRIVENLDSNRDYGTPILRTLARIHPKVALDLLLAPPTDGARFSSLGVSARDAVIEGLPADSNWAFIAETLAERSFRIGGSFINSSEEGPGGILFAKWAAEDHESAISWFRNADLNSYDRDGLNDSVNPSLIGDWFNFAPESASNWIELQLKTEENGIISILEKQIPHQLPNRQWLAWGKHLPDAETRYRILESVSKPAAISYTNAGTNSSIEITHGMSTTYIKKIIPEFDLHPNHKESILAIIKDRE